MRRLLLASALAHDSLRTSSINLRRAHDTRHDQLHPPGHGAAQDGRKRRGSSVSQFGREAAMMRARMASDKNPYPIRDLADQLRKIGEQGYALAEKALKVPEDEADRIR
jgi:hypothetical protein